MARRPNPPELDASIRQLLTFAAARLGEWVPIRLTSEEARDFPRRARWYAYSNRSPLGWCPGGMGNPTHARYSYDLEWHTGGEGDGAWTRSLHSAGAAHVDAAGMVHGRIKLRSKRIYKAPHRMAAVETEGVSSMKITPSDDPAV